MSAALDSVSSFLVNGVVVELDPDELRTVPDAPASGITKRSVPPPLPARAVARGKVATEQAFRELYEAHAPFVWRNLRRLGVADADVEDKLQEVFVVAHRRWDDFADRGHGPRAWLFQIVLRVAADARRHRRRHPVDPDGGIAQERQSIDAPQAAAVDKRQALDQLDRALATLDIGRRAVLVLHEIEQMTAPQIARTLEIPLNTVYSRLRVARIELEQALRESQCEDAR
jgi:RNA polymerase sigma-70 factor (ECF subfamily)